MKKKSKEEKAVEKRIERAYYATCAGIQIDVLDICKVFEHGKTLVAEGADDATLADGVRAFVETIRCDRKLAS